MKFEIQRDALFKALQGVIGVVEKRQTMPILSNVLLKTAGTELQITGTDLELELVNTILVEKATDGEIAVPARKLFDICRGLPEGANLSFEVKDQRATLKSGRSRFVLATMNAEEFPVLDAIEEGQSFSVSRSALAGLLDKTHFAMAHQDVRYYLNGLLLEVNANRVRCVATDGHRLAMSDVQADLAADLDIQVIVPRKAITEMQRLLGESDDQIELTVNAHHLQIQLGTIRFTSKLIDGRFPDYERVIPAEGTEIMVADRETVRLALSRTAILSNEKFRGVRLCLSDGHLRLQAHNPEHEEAEEDLEVDYSGSGLEIGFNVNYLMDALGCMQADRFVLELTSSDSSGLLREEGDDDSKYVVMPMRL
ncbi:MAG: DNA polymerase III subunit beta [Salinisphaeraceae bacterium]|nr:DNA polymerase III subunit beta [Salinisphaeraceae bacterium]